MTGEYEMELTGGSEETPEETPVEETPTPEAPEETPEETPVEVEETPEEAEETPEEPKLYETPDGRKLTAEELQTEWKENFLPEFTRKSQEFAEYKRGNEPNINNPKDEPEWKKDDYVPQSYAEVIELAKREALAEMQGAAKAEQEKAEAIRQTVENQLSEIKKTSPNLDENALFQHANKYGFQDLRTAHQNMVDMKKTAIDTEKRTVKILKTGRRTQYLQVKGEKSRKHPVTTHLKCHNLMVLVNIWQI